MKNLPTALSSAVEEARKAGASREAALTTLHSLDFTSLNSTDTPASIDTFLSKADLGKDGHVATVVVYPQFLTQVFNKVAATGMNIATVINFPSGKGELGQTKADVAKSIKDGANEVDIVLDYESFLKGDRETAFALLVAAREAATAGGAKLKVILESSVFENYQDLYDASVLALKAGTDFLKTSTGKHATGGATLEAAAVMLQAIKDEHSGAGLKISGGVKTVADGAKYIALTESLMGKNWIDIDHYRVGASGVMSDISAVLANKATTPPPSAPATGGVY